MTHPGQGALEYAGETIAADQGPLISAFRERGAPSFHQLGVAAARMAYEESCARNGLPPRADVRVEELWLTAEEGSGNSAVRARLYRPENSEAPQPTALFFHGGGWVMGSLDTHDALCRHLAAEARTAILAVDYRLSPEHPHPAPLEDARTALAWLRENGRRHGLDPKSLAVAGDSAGAHIAATLAREAPHIAGQLLLYPVVSAATDTASYRRLSRGFPLTAATMRWFMDLYTDGRTEPGEAITDLTVAPRPVPTFLCTVGHDPLCDGGIAYAAALARAGAEVQHVHLPQHAHGIFTSAGVVPTAERVLATACAFLLDLLRR